ncbi:unnamed product [Ostreococcus tauri]|uniref:Unnamed product n=1 Tax=Ostreococcus tauri TaxID=70448 RepID=A0A090M4U9_OSTTA|nr:unnamed product [Ostreococcus tauri]CEF97702.1 unnamed product [Ostreococcus tauri]|eukprot:XP_003078965.2 unnamed product [Ostreococcus tauri]
MREALRCAFGALARARASASSVPSTSGGGAQLETFQNMTRIRCDSARTRVARRAYATEDDAIADKVRREVRAGDRPAFVDVAAHVFGTEDDASLGRAKRARGWDWHAVQLLIACVPAALSYAAVMEIERTYVPQYAREMEKREARQREKVLETTRADAMKGTHAQEAMERRLAELEARVRGMEETKAAEKTAEKAKPVTVKGQKNS